MSRLIIACSMLEDEVNLVLRECRSQDPVRWLDRGLHEFPGRLRQILQQTIDESGADEILLTQGLCGNALAGVGSDRATLVAPAVHDCIHMLLRVSANEAPAPDSRSLYFTDGWFRSERFITNEYEACVRQYGREQADDIFEMMLKNYRSLTLIDTGAYDCAAACERGRRAARMLGLSFSVEQGSLRILRKLFSGQWDSEFLVLPPGERFRQDQFCG